MSSYELLELLEFIPEEGVFKTALRDGEWAQSQRAVFQCANELAILRAAQLPEANSDDWGSMMFFSPAKLRELVAAQAERAEGRDAVNQIGAD